MSATYTVSTWDPETEDFTVETGDDGQSMTGLDIHGLRQSLRILQGGGYSCHRLKHLDESDPSVLVTRDETT